MEEVSQGEKPRTIEEINQDYANACMLLGNIHYQEHIFPKKKTDLLNEMTRLNEEAASLKEKSDV